MPSPWERPPTGSPFRRGETNADALYVAVGRALSKWEGLEGEMVHLYANFIGSNEAPFFNIPAIRAFGTLNSPASKADMIAAAAEAFFHYLGFEAGIDAEQVDTDEFEAIEAEFREILKAYRGWMSRRNDVAHGYAHSVTHEDEKTTYLWFPSDGSTGKWCVIVGEPAFAYEAKLIDPFGEAFEALEERVRTFADRLGKFRQKMKELIPESPQQ